MSEQVKSSMLFDAWIASADAERARKARARNVLSRGDHGVELSAFGYLRWYTHPRLDDAAVRSFYCFELEIPAHSRSGKIRHQGNLVCFVVTGDGYTVLDGTAHPWEKHDLVAIPPVPDGWEIQHFNPGPAPARLVVAIPDLDSALGPELGVRFEVLEPAPEFAALHG